MPRPPCSTFDLRMGASEDGIVVASSASTGEFQWRTALGSPLHGMYSARVEDTSLLTRCALTAFALPLPCLCSDLHRRSIPLPSFQSTHPRLCCNRGWLLLRVLVSVPAPQASVLGAVEGGWVWERVHWNGRRRACGHGDEDHQW